MSLYSELTRQVLVKIGLIASDQPYVESIIGRCLTFCVEDLSISRSNLSYEIVEKRARTLDLQDILNNNSECYVRQSLVFSAKIINLLESRCLKESRGLHLEEGSQFDKIIPRITIDIVNLVITGHLICVSWLEIDLDSGDLYLIYEDVNELAVKTDEGQQLSKDVINSVDIEAVSSKSLKIDKYYLV